LGLPEGHIVVADHVAGPTVVVVDDEPMVAQLIQDALEEAGFQVVLALDCDGAIAVVESHLDDLAGIVTDVNLGAGPTGWDVAAKAREMIPTLPVIYVTGDSGHLWPSHGVPQSVIITKPFAAAQIVVALAGLANQSHTAS